MRGDFVSLQRCTDEDYERIADWALSSVSTYSSGSPQLLGGADIRQAARQGGMNYMMVVTHEGERIGAVNWGPLAYQGSYTIGSAIGASGLWSQGYGAEANVLLLNHLFHALNAHRVQLTLGMHNRHMVQIVMHGGFVVEGILRDYFFVDGRHFDAVTCSLLRSEFYALAEDSELGLAADTVPAEEKEAARSMFADHLERRSAGYLLDLLER
ncbi:GNAT family N-acetyltransferase [Streptomyces sp. A3M-1-3]|uniref:GNAT family N-acetyltransferase n=1 Tax=Streptomyces sp. A3M-1-3 TaxID=2962044 RepID=UPI0020B6784E|nr:GNAT family protein [Streptomyces sp. A3M-1-3]MCP3821627.1 GNAT family N-acetyltransferase [Streptomyces sp. A3M-1-3]